MGSPDPQHPLCVSALLRCPPVSPASPSCSEAQRKPAGLWGYLLQTVWGHLKPRGTGQAAASPPMTAPSSLRAHIPQCIEHPHRSLRTPRRRHISSQT